MSSTGTLKTIVTVDNSTTAFFDISATGIYIEGVHCYNYLGQLIIAWTTGSHKPMILNVTTAWDTPITINTEATSPNDIKQLYLFPEFNHNNFTLTSNTTTTVGAITTGGRLPAGAYFFSLTYEIEDGVNTNFGVVSSPIFIVEDDLLTAYRQFKGSSSLAITNKAITLSLTDLDTSYRYFKIAIIQKTETGTNCFITKRIRLNATTASAFIDDIDKLSPFNINEVVISTPAFDKVKTLTQANKKLRLGYPEKTNKVSLINIYDHVMPYLSINWASDKTVSLNNTIGSYKDPVFIFNSRQFKSDEVYALYLGLKVKTGGYYGIYHIPGRIDTGTELTDATTVDGTSIKNFRLTSSATKDVSGYYGPMGYWENNNETYNNNYGSILANNNVRHHRFPSLKQLHGWKSGILHTTAKGIAVQTLTFTGTACFEIGSTDVLFAILPLNAIPIIGTYTPAASPTTYANTYVATFTQVIALSFNENVRLIDTVAAGATAMVTIIKYTKTLSGYTPTTLYGPITKTTVALDETLNFTYTADVSLNVGDYITFQIEIHQLSTHAPSGTPGLTHAGNIIVYEATQTQDILALRIALNWAAITSAYPATAASLLSVVDSWEILYAKRTLNNQLMLDQSLVIADGAGFRFYGFDSMSNLLNIEPTHAKSELYIDSGSGDYIESVYINEITNYRIDTTRYGTINKIKYLPAYNSATIPINTTRENCYYFETISAITFDKRLVSLINIKNNVYLDFTNQELVSTGVIKRLQTTSAFSLYGGDTYVGHNSVLTFPSALITVPKIWYFPTETILNSGMRYEGENDYEKFYPLTDITAIDTSVTPNIMSYIDSMHNAGVANLYLYNNDYHLLNTFRQDVINTELTSIYSKNPNRIHSSIPQPDSVVSMYWRKFKPLDYVDIPNNKGPIYKMIGNDRIVYIKTEYSVFRGIIVDSLITGNIDVALKTSEMFDRPVDELLDTDGTYIKCWDREGMIFTPYGLVVVDLEKGSIFVISDKADEITKLGIEDWFRDTVKRKLKFNTTNKETIGSGVVLGYDDIYKRLLVTLRNENLWNGTLLGTCSATKTTTILVTVTTTNDHPITTGDTIRIVNSTDSNCTGVFIATKTGAKTFTYPVVTTGTGAITVTSLKTVDDITLSFNFERMYWVAFHNYAPDKYLWNANGLYSITALTVRKLLSGNYGYHIGNYVYTTVDFIFNNNAGERFLLKNVNWVQSFEANEISYWDSPIGNMMIYSKNLCTGLVNLTKRAYQYNAGTYILEEAVTPDASNKTVLFQDGKWIMNDISDYLITPNSVFIDGNFDLVSTALNLSKTWSDRSKFISKFFIVRLSHLNTSANKKLRITNISVDVKPIL